MITFCKREYTFKNDAASVRTRLYLPRFEEGFSGAPDLFYGKLEKELLFFAENKLLPSCTRGGWIELEGCGEDMCGIASVTLDFTACADSRAIAFRRTAQNWDEKGRLISSHELFRRCGLKIPRKAGNADGYRICGGAVEGFVNRFAPSENTRHISKCRSSVETLSREICNISSK